LDARVVVVVVDVGTSGFSAAKINIADRVHVGVYITDMVVVVTCHVCFLTVAPIHKHVRLCGRERMNSGAAVQQ
jgi:hypothetical protein